MDAEQRILCLAARTSLDADARSRLTALVRAGCDWERLWYQAHLHEVVPLVTATLQSLDDRDRVPGTWLARGERRLVATLLRNSALQDELLTAVAALRSADVEPLAVKGIVLSHTLYRSLSLRPAADIDVLVRPQERPAARHALRTLGYGHRAQLLFAEAHHPYPDPQYFRATRRGEVCLELHHALWHPRFFARDDGIFDRAVVVELDGAAVRTLSPEDTLLHLAIHRTRSPLRLRLVCDVAELVRGAPALRWDEVLQRARRLRARTAVHTALSLARDHLGAPVPAEVLTGLQVGEIKRRALEHICGATAMFRPAPAGELRQQPHLVLRALEQDGAARIARSLARALPRKAQRQTWQMRQRALAKVASSRTHAG